MKKLKNKFILAVILIISVIILSQVFIAYSNNNIDTNSYLKLIKGNATLNEQYLTIWEKYILLSGDKVRVIGDSSLAVIDWWDGSVTRLWWNTKISIDENQVSKDFTNINISFDLIAWKTWSKVVSFIGKDSSFTQTFDGIEAGVRGTVFDVDLDNEFIHVSDHQVLLTAPNGEQVTISEGNVLQLQDFTFIEISEFINSLQDTAWKQLNEDFDNEYTQFLKEELNETLYSSNPLLFILDWFSPKYRLLFTLNTADDYKEVEEVIAKLSKEDYSKVYNAVLSQYQKINFVTANDYEFYKRKVFYQKALIELATDDKKEAHLRSVTYDVADLIEWGQIDGLYDSIGSLLEHQDILENIDTNFLKNELDMIPEWLRIEFWESLKDLENILDIESFQEINIDNAWQKLQDWLDAIDEWIQNLLDENAGKFLENFVQ